MLLTSTNSYDHPLSIQAGLTHAIQPEEILDAVAELPRIQRVRLFGHYRDSHGHYMNPIKEDKVAVQIFRHLRSKRSTIETLEISPDVTVAWRAAKYLYLKSWEVRSLGRKIGLTVKETNKDYEQRQIWEGSRCLTTAIKRYTYNVNQANFLYAVQQDRQHTDFMPW